MNLMRIRKVIGKILIWSSILILLFVVLWLAENWPVDETGSKKGLAFWIGNESFSFSYPTLVDFFWNLGLLFFFLGSVLVLWGNARNWIRNYTPLYLLKFFAEFIKIFSVSLLMLAFFGLHWKNSAVIKFLLTSFILFLLAIFIESEYIKMSEFSTSL